MALGHLGINVADLDVARRYYGAVMGPLGHECYVDDHDQFAYRPADGKRGTYLWFYPAADDTPYHRERTGLQHLAFMVPTRSAVRAAFDAAVAAGSAVIEPPRAFPEYPPPYFAAFWTDPFGMVLEAVCHHDRD